MDWYRTFPGFISDVNPIAIYDHWKYKNIILQQIRGAGLFEQQTAGYTLLHNAVQEKNQKEIVILRESNIDPNVQDSQGQTALYVACIKGYIEGVEELLKFKNIDLNVQQKDGWTPIAIIIIPYVQQQTAILNRHEIIKLLLEHGANPNQKDRLLYKFFENDSLLHQACRQEDFEIVNLLIKYGAIVNIQDRSGQTPLKTAVYFYKENQNDAFKIIKLLLEHKADSNIQDNFMRNTVLHDACEQKNYDLAKLLLEYKANPNLLNDKKETPLHIACEKGSYNLVKLLLEYNADPTIKGRFGETPVNIAKRMGKKELINLFLVSAPKINIPIEPSYLSSGILLPQQLPQIPWYQKYKKQLVAAIIALIGGLGIFGYKYFKTKRSVQEVVK